MSDSEEQKTDVETAERLMECVLAHYIKHHHVVLEKLRLAQRATTQTLKDISAFCGEFQEKEDPKTAKTLEKSRNVWEKNIQLFIDTGISEVGLLKIDKVLTTIPTSIKKHYDLLMEAETDLLKAIDELQHSTEDYKEAYKHVRTIQSVPDKMSGLDPSHYDDEPEDDQEKAYKIIVSSKKTDSMH